MKVFHRIDNGEGEPLFEQIAAEPDGRRLFKLVTKPPAEPHKFGEARSVPADPARGRHQQTEKACTACGLVKITVHPPTGGGWREWRWGDAPGQFVDVVEPECTRGEEGRGAS